jgi:hypothetical protein
MKIYQFYEGDNRHYLDCLKSIEAQAKKDNIEYIHLQKSDCNKYDINWSESLRFATEKLRVKIFLEDNEARWIDADSIARGTLKVEYDKNIPYVCCKDNMFDTWDIYVNGNNEVFKEYKGGYLYNFVNELGRRNKIRKMESNVLHFSLGTAEARSNMNWSSIGFSTHSIIKDGDDIQIIINGEK